MHNLQTYLAQQLHERELQGNLRSLTLHGPGTDFFSNDYLGWAAMPLNDTLPMGTGATGSRLLSGHSELAAALETQIAAFHETEGALLFNSGYDANIGLFAAIANRHTTILYDALCHASILDGIRLSQAKHAFKFAHNNLAALEEKLQRCTEGPVIVAVESVYSMDGDQAPLAELVRLSEQYGFALVVDEAHATGVFGAHGEGLTQARGLHQKVFARVHTFGKALGCHGAAVVGSNVLKQYLLNFARSFIYTTALPPHSLLAIQQAYGRLAAPGFTNAVLHDRIAYFKRKAAEIPGKWLVSDSPIQGLVLGGNELTRKIAAQLREQGIRISAVLHPTVAVGAERLRICLHQFNTEAEIDQLIELINRCLCNEQ
jgi:8-amino-7-oxononanoate synthase